MLSNKLKELRHQKNISQSELAKYLDVAQQSVGKWEKDITRPSFEMLEKLADFFHVTTDYLLGRHPEEVEKLIQEAARQIVKGDVPKLTPGLLRGLGGKVNDLPEEDQRRDIIGKVVDMDEETAKAANEFVSFLYSKQGGK